MQEKSEPIVARATAAGRGGIGIVRISGESEDISFISKALFGEKPLEPRHAHLKEIKDSQGELIDQAIVLFFPAPHSYTAETVLEIQAHGGLIVVDRIIERALDVGSTVGIRLARPGEFTERAFLNGRIDLAQAEAVADLIDAGSEAAARAASRSLQGVFSKEIQELNEELLSLRTYVEATLDFPEEEVDFIEKGNIRKNVSLLLERLERINKAAMRGKTLRDGLHVVLVGEPNVGKSSLMNALAGRDVSIVTEVAGTTRDRIECEINLDGLLIKVTDTAGLRETKDIVESLGVQRAKEAVESADVVIFLKDASKKAFEKEEELAFLAGHIRSGVTYLNVVNKIDLCPEVPSPLTKDDILISAKTGSGLDALISRLKALAGCESGEGDFIARTRHLECLSRAKESLEKVSLNLEAMNLELAAEEMRLAGNALGEIVGETLPDDILGRIFSTFCIGK